MTLFWYRPLCFSHELPEKQLDLHDKSSKVCINQESVLTNLNSKSKVDSPQKRTCLLFETL